MTKREKLLSGLDVSRLRGIEIGALASPIIRKSESEVYYVDHAERETLRAKYAHDPKVNVEEIVSVDAVWGEQTLRECFPDGSEFDYVAASHLIEHVPDILGWLREVADVLRPGGRLLLVIPDKRYTFDYLRTPSRLSEVFDAYLRHNRRPMPGQIFDHKANAVKVDPSAAWEDRIDTTALKHHFDLREALDLSIASVRDGRYIDGHCWVFMPRTFAALLYDLVDLDLLTYTCLNLYETEPGSNEFIVVLERWAEDAAMQKENALESFRRHVDRLYEDEMLNDPKVRALNKANAENTELRHRVQMLESDVAALISSHSFRITQPLRKLAALARRLRERN